MTDLEPFDSGPSCPICGTNDRTTRDWLGGSHDGRVPARRVWLCGTCWTVFQSGQHEWDRNREVREAYRKRYETSEVAA